MSYARWSDGDVYVYDDVDGTTHCCMCSIAHLGPTPHLSDWCTKTHAEMVAHLMAHQEVGHVVPEYAIAALLESED